MLAATEVAARGGRGDDGAVSQMVTVRDILHLPVFQRAKVVAGAEGLGRSVSAVTVGEVPDQEKYLRGGEIILTALYAFRDDPAVVASAIEKYAQRGAAAVAFKPGVYLSHLGAEAIKVAESIPLPVIEVPFSVRWREIIHEVVQEIAGKGNKLQRNLSRALLEGRSLAQGLAVLKEAVQAEVVLFDRNVRFLTGTGPGSSEAQKQGEDDFARWLRGSRLAQRLVADRTVSEVVPPGGVGGGARLICAVTGDQDHLGYLTLRGKEGSYAAADRESLQQAATMVGIELMRQSLTRSVDLQSRERLLGYLLANEDGGAEKVQKGDYPMGLVVAMRPSAAERVSDERLRELQVELLTRTGATLGELNRHVLVGCKMCDVIVFLPVSQPRKGEGGLLELKALSEPLRLVAEEVLGERVLVGVGSCCYSLADVRQSFQEALKVLNLCSAVENARRLKQRYDSDLSDLLGQVDPAYLSSFCERTLAPLLEYDRKRQTELLKTVAVFFECDKNISRTAEVLYLHRNSLNHRLEQISNLSGLDFGDMDACLTWQVALKIHSLTKKDQGTAN